MHLSFFLGVAVPIRMPNPVNQSISVFTSDFSTKNWHLDNLNTLKMSLFRNLRDRCLVFCGLVPFWFMCHPRSLPFLWRNDVFRQTDGKKERNKELLLQGEWSVVSPEMRYDLYLTSPILLLLISVFHLSNRFPYYFFLNYPKLVSVFWPWGGNLG